MRTHDVSTEPKTGLALSKIVSEDIQWSQDTFGLSVVALCSDDGGDARLMRKLLQASMPWLIVILCWAHQINLIVGDYLSLRIPFLECVPRAMELIKWTNNHSRALGIFRQEQMSTYGKVLALIRPVITRWTAHYLSLRRLLEVDIPMKTAWLKHSDKMLACVGPKADAQAQAMSIKEIVEDHQFWYQVKM